MAGIRIGLRKNNARLPKPVEGTQQLFYIAGVVPALRGFRMIGNEDGSLAQLEIQLAFQGSPIQTKVRPFRRGVRSG